MKRISVIIVTYNSEKHIYDCLSSLFNYNDIGDDLEVIIVDNKSANFSQMRDKLRNKYDDKIRIIENDRNGGYGQGNNVGIRASNAPIIMIMNPDVRLVEPVFKEAVSVFEDKRVALFGFQQLDLNGNRGYSISCSSTIHPIIGLPLTVICNKMKLYIPKIMFVAGACFFIKKDAFESVGLFDENIFMYMEEDDIHYRLSKIEGIKFKYDSHIAYHHLHGLGLPDKPIDDIRAEIAILKSNIYLNEKRGFSKGQIINREIVYSKMFRLKKQIMYLLGEKSAKKEIGHWNIWIHYLIGLRNKEC